MIPNKYGKVYIQHYGDNTCACLNCLKSQINKALAVVSIEVIICSSHVNKASSLKRNSSGRFLFHFNFQKIYNSSA